MANKKTLALTTEQYKDIITTMRTGFIGADDKVFNPNTRIATILVLQANLGLRIGDVLQLRLNSFIKDGDRYRLDITEKKTSKSRTFTVPAEIYSYIQGYAYDNEIKVTAKLFEIGERAVQKQLKLVVDHLGIQGIGTHSFRKYFATQIYINNNYNIKLVSELLQHSNTTITQRYIGIEQKDIETALNNHIYLL